MKKKVLILGASSDIGIELSKKYLLENDYILDLHYSSNLKSLKKYEKNCNIIKADLSKKDTKKILKKFKNNYDIIVNLVGYINNRSFEKFTISSLEKTIRINSMLPLLIIRKSLNNMKEKKWGRIVNSSSIGVKFGGGEKTFEYSMSKHLNEFIPSHIRKLAEKNIFFNIIKIGLTNTKMHKKITNKNIVKRTKLVPTKKMATPKDISNYIFYISTSKNQFITGEVVNIAGGE
tara:strand:- start:119 stop:817 length:699 start_codon:yes stop_codon:yes gene_type:complete